LLEHSNGDAGAFDKFSGRVDMAKGQVRTNKEVKKPKKDKKTQAPIAPFGANPIKPGGSAPEKKK
jgi:hypothetical protein